MRQADLKMLTMLNLPPTKANVVFKVVLTLLGCKDVSWKEAKVKARAGEAFVAEVAAADPAELFKVSAKGESVKEHFEDGSLDPVQAKKVAQVLPPLCVWASAVWALFKFYDSFTP
eukprot:Hpha_TRINITY_DN14492_c1_g1::TRINITY_DN14492_c1_g1_i1::g.157820::m.157820